MRNLSIDDEHRATWYSIPCNQRIWKKEIKVVRYADDFVILGKTLESVQKAESLVSDFLKPVGGLKLLKEKTRIGHSIENKPGITGPIGLDFFILSFSKYSVFKTSRSKEY